MKIEKVKNLRHIIVDEPKRVLGDGDKGYADRFMAGLDRPYENAFSVTLPLKNSVSAILNKSNENDILDKDDFLTDPMYQDAILESTALGTLYHSAMQCYKLGQSDEAFLCALQTQFDTDERASLNEEKLINCKHKLDELINGEDVKIYQEQKFMMYVPYCSVFENESCQDKILIQGIVDIIIEFKDKVFLIDYKTNKTKNKQKLIEHYEKQLQLYKMAIEKSFHKETISCLYAFSVDDFIYF